MRRTDRQTSESDAYSILERGEFGILSSISESGELYGVPMNYCVIDQNVYLHSAREGKKVENLLFHPEVSFSVVINTEVLPGEFASKYESCVLQGLAEEVSGDDKQSALESFIFKYSRDFFAEGKVYIEKLKDQTKVFRVSINSISGKARK
ncbi:MAG: pyridoxamine 5'-phosphate oxidase family protein [Spirochaetaceae bacterium]|nr:pyridoxamine 5'-phosphate oxidase family protein [Spirochaetaceae bacterium]